MLAVALAALLPAGCAPTARPAPVRPAARPIAAEAVPTARPSVGEPASVAGPVPVGGPVSLAPRSAGPAARVPVRSIPAATRQLIVVQSDGYGATTATVETFRQAGLVPGDWWDDNPASPGYNRFVHGTGPGAGSEALWQVSPQYTYFAVIGYNLPARPGRGSAIFLHVVHPGYATDGCVSLPVADLLRVLRWLDPAAEPRIVMAPRQALGRY